MSHRLHRIDGLVDSHEVEQHLLGPPHLGGEDLVQLSKLLVERLGFFKHLGLILDLTSAKVAAGGELESYHPIIRII